MKGSGQRMRLALDGHLALLHRLQQRGLGLGRRAVDLVGQQQVGEHRALAEPERALGGLEDHLADHVRRHQVGGELHPLELQVQGSGHGLDQQGLGRARHAFEQDVAAHQQGGHQARQGAVLADHHLGHLVAQGQDRRPDRVGPVAAGVGGVGAAAHRLGVWGRDGRWWWSVGGGPGSAESGQGAVPWRTSARMGSMSRARSSSSASERTGMSVTARATRSRSTPVRRGGDLGHHLGAAVGGQAQPLGQAPAQVVAQQPGRPVRVTGLGQQVAVGRRSARSPRSAPAGARGPAAPGAGPGTRRTRRRRRAARRSASLTPTEMSEPRSGPVRPSGRRRAVIPHSTETRVPERGAIRSVASPALSYWSRASLVNTLGPPTATTWPRPTGGVDHEGPLPDGEAAARAGGHGVEGRGPPEGQHRAEARQGRRCRSVPRRWPPARPGRTASSTTRDPTGTNDDWGSATTSDPAGLGPSVCELVGLGLAGGVGGQQGHVGAGSGHVVGDLDTGRPDWPSSMHQRLGARRSGGVRVERVGRRRRARGAPRTSVTASSPISPTTQGSARRDPPSTAVAGIGSRGRRPAHRAGPTRRLGRHRRRPRHRGRTSVAVIGPPAGARRRCVGGPGAGGRPDAGRARSTTASASSANRRALVGAGGAVAVPGPLEQLGRPAEVRAGLGQGGGHVAAVLAGGPAGQVPHHAGRRSARRPAPGTGSAEPFLPLAGAPRSASAWRDQSTAAAADLDPQRRLGPLRVAAQRAGRERRPAATTTPTRTARTQPAQHRPRTRRRTASRPRGPGARPGPAAGTGSHRLGRAGRNWRWFRMAVALARLTAAGLVGLGQRGGRQAVKRPWAKASAAASSRSRPSVRMRRSR